MLWVGIAGRLHRTQSHGHNATTQMIEVMRSSHPHEVNPVISLELDTQVPAKLHSTSLPSGDDQMLLGSSGEIP